MSQNNSENVGPVVDNSAPNAAWYDAYLSVFNEFADVISYDISKIGVVVCDPTHISSFLTALRDAVDVRFTILTDLFGVDYPHLEKRFEVVYNLLSLSLNRRLIIKVKLSDGESVDTATGVFSAACWYEREAFDMYGIVFTGTHDLRRILTDYGFEGHPLRKDFPLTGFVEVRYDNEKGKIVQEPVVLDQEYRNFDFISPWQDITLPGDEKA